jgi:hypothetical protein
MVEISHSSFIFVKVACIPWIRQLQICRTLSRAGPGRGGGSLRSAQGLANTPSIISMSGARVERGTFTRRHRSISRRTFRDDLSADYKASGLDVAEPQADSMVTPHEALGVRILNSKLHEMTMSSRLTVKAPPARLRRRDRHRRQGFLSARARRHPGIQPP